MKQHYLFVSIFASLAVLLLLCVYRPISVAAQEVTMDRNGADTGRQIENEGLDIATFAGGCFWCLQPSYDKLPGVKKTVVGYTGGHVENPSYEQIGTGTTGHVEAIRVLYDPKQISFDALVEEFWRNIDPTQADGQFADRGPQYQTAIFYHDDAQKRSAQRATEQLAATKKFSRPIATKILPASEFYLAEEYHQDYYKKNSTHYNLYKIGSGRADFIKQVWGKE